MVDKTMALQATKCLASSWSAAVCFVFMAQELALLKAMDLEVTRQSPVITSASLTLPSVTKLLSHFRAVK